MKTTYKQLGRLQWWLLLFMAGLASSPSLMAQLNTPPVIQGQQVIEATINNSSRERLARSSTGNFGFVTETALGYLTPVAKLISVGAVEGSVQTGTSPVEYTKVVRTYGLAPTSDGGFIVLANDAFNLYVIKKDANQNRVWSTILGNQADYSGIDLVRTPDGDFLAFANHAVAGSLSNVTVSRIKGDGTLLWSRDIFSNQPTNPSGVNSRGFGQVSVGSDGTYLITGGQFSQLRRPQPVQSLAAKIDGQATLLWSRTYDQIVGFSDHVPNPYEGGTFLALGSTDPNFTGTQNGPTFPYKMQTDGALIRLGSYIANGGSRIASDGSGQPYYVILESVAQNGGDFKLTGFNQLFDAVWTKTLGGSLADTPQAILATGDGYLLGGNTASSDGDVKGKTGSNTAIWMVKLTKTATPLVLSQPTYNCLSGEIIFNITGGNGSPITYNAPGVSRSSLTSNTGIVEQELRNDPKPITITAIQSGVSVSYTFDFKSVCSNPGGLNLFLGSYNCQTGALVFATTGGDGSPVTFLAPGVTRASASSTTGVVEKELRNDPKPITITAIQSGRRVDFTFDFGAYCASQPPPATTLTLLAPTYNCTTGAFTFNSSGGNGSPIEYQAAGITGWTTNPNQFVDRDSRTASDVQPFTLMARQSGVTVTYVWDLKAACGRLARTAALPEPGTQLQVRVLGNPVINPTAEVDIMGAEHQTLQLNLVDLQGRVLHQQRIEQAEATQRVRVPMGERNGLFLLNVSTSTQRQQVKLLKP